MSDNYGTIVKDGLWENNVVFAQMLALCPTMAVTTSGTNGLGMGLSTTHALGVPGETLAGVEDAVDFIARLRQCDDKSTLPIGRRVVVIGGGLAGASRYILPSLIAELNSSLQMMDGTTVNRLQMKAFNLEEEDQFTVFAKGVAVKIRVPGTDRQIDYDPFKRFGVMISKQGTSRSVALGAYVYALDQL